MSETKATAGLTRCIKPHCPTDCKDCSCAISTQDPVRMLMAEVLDTLAVDGHYGPYEDGEVPVVDKARQWLASANMDGAATGNELAGRACPTCNVTRTFEWAKCKGCAMERVVFTNWEPVPAPTPTPLQKLGGAIEASLITVPAADVLSILIGSMVGLVVELMRRQGLDASEQITIDGGESRDITIHPEKRGPLQ